MAKKQKLELLQDILGKFYNSGNEYLFQCPNPTCNQNKKKLSINLDKNVFKCWVCDLKGSNVKRIVRRYGSFLQKQQWNTISGEVDISTSCLDLFCEDNSIEVPTTIKLPKEFISLANKDLPLSSLKARRYLSSRNISKEDILKWKLGYCKSGEYENRIVVPSFNKDGDVNYFVARTYVDDWHSYSNPQISKDLVFNELYVDWLNDLVLVEGVFDAFKADNAIPLLGSSLREDSKLFQEILKHDTPIYLGLDPDAEKKSFALIKSFLLYDVEMYKIDVTGFKDVGEMTKEEFRNRKKSAVRVDSETYVENLWR